MQNIHRRWNPFWGGDNYLVLFRLEDHCLGLVCRGWEEVAE